MPRTQTGSTRDLAERILGYGLILFVLWMPEFPQRILSPVALVATRVGLGYLRYSSPQPRR